MRLQAKKLVEAYRLSGDDETDDPGEIAKGCALIRANFNIDPTVLSEEEWAMMFQQAVWLENFRLVNTAKILSKLFAPVE